MEAILIYIIDEIGLNSQDEGKEDKLADRADTILYLVKHGIIDVSKYTGFYRRILSYIVSIYSTKYMTKYGDFYKGSQTGFTYDKGMITKYPWETTVRINSSFGRLKTLYNMEELSSLSTFIQLDSGNDI